MIFPGVGYGCYLLKRKTACFHAQTIAPANIVLLLLVRGAGLLHTIHRLVLPRCWARSRPDRAAGRAAGPAPDHRHAALGAGRRWAPDPSRAAAAGCRRHTAAGAADWANRQLRATAGAGSDSCAVYRSCDTAGRQRHAGVAGRSALALRCSARVGCSRLGAEHIRRRDAGAAAGAGDRLPQLCADRRARGVGRLILATRQPTARRSAICRPDNGARHTLGTLPDMHLPDRLLQRDHQWLSLAVFAGSGCQRRTDRPSLS